MGSRKRAKLNPVGRSSAPLPALMSPLSSSPATTARSTASSRSSLPPQRDEKHNPETADGPAAPADPQQQVQKTRSWYGSWPRAPKSAASTHVARESILGGTSKPTSTANLDRFDTKRSLDSTSIDDSKPPSTSSRSSNRGVIDTAAASHNKSESPHESGSPHESESQRASTTEQATAGRESSGGEDAVKAGAPDADAMQVDAEQRPSQPASPTAAPPASPTPTPPAPPTHPSGTSSWVGWLWSSPPPQTQRPAAETHPEASANEAAKEEAAPALSAKPPRDNEEPARNSEEPARNSEEPAKDSEESAKDLGSRDSHQEQQPRTAGSWLGLWPGWRTTGAPTAHEPTTTAAHAAEPAKEPQDSTMQDAPVEEAPPEQPPAGQPAAAQPADVVTPKAGSTWAFWSRDAGSGPGTKPTAQQEQGQLAVMGESTESHPRQSGSIDVDDAPPKEPRLKRTGDDDQSQAAAMATKDSSSGNVKRPRTKSVEVGGAPPSQLATPEVGPRSKNESSSSKAAPAKTQAPGAAAQPNLLLPSFKSTYRTKRNPSMLKEIAQLFLHSQQPRENHVFLAKKPPKIKKAFAIGVHGLFPANYLRPMIGQPTGTSIKFANHCAEAIRRWADAHGCDGCEIEKVALEGEGKVGERVENLWKLLLNWISDIRGADLIVLACHSQGVPVTMMLLAKLIEMGIVTNARIGVCAMAGVSLGPFPERASMGYLMGSAAELWDFSKPDSDVSKRLEEAVRVVLNFGARITYIASIDDQLVPIESAVYSPVNHPYVYRSVFIDGRIHAPDFIANLVGFALKLRNLGVSDHGLIRELSSPLAGSLYSGEGHSRLYEDEQVYDLAVAHALETTDVAGVACEVHKFEGLTQPNPYHLPWVMRGLLEEDLVKTGLSHETAELLRQFDDWRPVTRALKDVKYRLGAVRSRL